MKKGREPELAGTLRAMNAAQAARAAAPGADPSGRVYTRWLVLGIVALLLGVLSIAIEQVVMGVALSLLGALFTAVGALGRTLIRASGALMRALDHIEHRRFADAQVILDGLDASSRVSAVRRAVRIQRGIIAMRRGDVERALRHLDEALVTEPSALARWYYGDAQQASVLGLRSFLRATRGDAEGAGRDAAATRAIPSALPSALAYAALGQAVLAERSGDREALRERLAEEEALLLEATGPRERAIVRAYQRMVQRTAAVSVYRRRAPRESERDEAGEPALAEWIAAVVPGAAPFVKTRKIVGDPIDPIEAREAAPIAKQGKAPAATRPRVTARARIRAAAVAVMIVGLSALVMVLRNEDPLRPGPNGQPIDLFAMASALGIALAGAVAFVLGIFVVRFVQTRRAMARLVEASRLFTRGDLDGSEAAARPLANAKLPLTAAQADLALARVASIRGQLAEALKLCDRAIGRLHEPSHKALAADAIEPAIQAERAFLLAALDRRDEAIEALGALAAARSPFVAARLRVQVLLAARQGDLAGAAAVIARCPPDLSMSRRDELLFDVVRAAVAPDDAGRAEIGRLRDELRGWALGREWLDRVAPTALRQFERVSTEGDGAEDDEAPRDRAEEEEREAIGAAEREAIEADEAAPSPRRAARIV